jgi:hypothetical protein
MEFCRLFAATILIVGSVSAEMLTAGSIEARIRAQGVKLVVAEFVKQPAQWEQVLNRVQSGDPAWLQVAVVMKAGTDGGLTASLDQAVSLAIQNNPTGVLELTPKGFSIGTICQDRQIEPTPQQHAAFLLHTRAALEKISRKDLVAAKKACLSELQP